MSFYNMSEEIILDITPPSSPLLVADKEAIFKNKQDDPFQKISSFHWFTCIGDAKLESLELNDESHVKNNETSIFNELDVTHSYCSQPKSVLLFNETVDFGSAFIFEREWLFRSARSNILLLLEASQRKPSEFHMISELHSNLDYVVARKECVKVFFALREYLCWLNHHNHTWVLRSVIPDIEEDLRKFRLFLGRLSDLQEYVLHRGVAQQGHKCLEAPYHLFHCSLDILWLHLTSVYQLDKIRRLLGTNLTESQGQNTIPNKISLDHYVLSLVADLIDLALIRFQKFQADTKSLLIKSSFTCNCVAELWVLIQQMTSDLSRRGIIDNFWSYVNRVLDGMLSAREEPKIRPSCVELSKNVTRSCSNIHTFSLWFLKHTAMVYSQDISKNCSNYLFLESVVKNLLSTDVTEANLRIYLSLIEKIVTRYWEPKSEVIILLWEYFQKRLNNTFYIPGSTLDSMTNMSETVCGMVKQVKSRLSSQYQGEDSYNMFLRLLGLHLQRVSGQSQHWNQIRGRIYSKLSVSKVQSLTEVGLYHFASLFLTLAHTADINEVSKKVQTLVMSEQEISSRQLVWRLQLSLCLLMAERGLDFSTLLTPLTTQLNTLQPTQQHIPLFRTYIEALKAILEASHCLRVDYNVLIGGWIQKYLADSSQNDCARLLETIITIIQRVQKQPTELGKFQSEVWLFVGPYVRQHVSEETSLPLAEVCLKICSLSHSSSETMQDVVSLLLNNPAVNVSLIRRFLWLLVQSTELFETLKNKSLSCGSFEVLIIKGWMRCSLLTLDHKSSELSRLTNCVTYLPFVADICMDLTSAVDPLLHFIVAVSNKFKTAQDICERGSIRQRFSCLLNSIDKWIDTYLKHSTSPEILSRIYHIVGLIFSLMPSFIYVKSRPNTVLKGLLDVMFLHVGAYKPNFEPSCDAKTAISSYLHLYIKGLSDLAVMKDCYIDRCISELVKVYLPWVVGMSRCALHECVASADGSARLILDSVCTSFIKPKASTPHPHCSQALKFLSLIVTTYSRECKVMLLLVDTCFQRLCDMLMFCDDHHRPKSEAKYCLLLLFECHCFGDKISSKIVDQLNHLCQAHLPFLPGKVFALLHEVMQHRPEIIARLLPDLQNQIKIVESKRGIQFDQSLRMYLGKLDNALTSIRNGV